MIKIREIKFRVWNKVRHFMDSAWLIDWEHGLVAHSKHNQSNLDDCVLMQYTGRKDCHGKEIYEGDVVKTFNKTYDDTERNNEVTFSNGSFRLRSNDDYISDIPLGNYRTKEIEVVGNIFEMPDWDF